MPSLVRGPGGRLLRGPTGLLARGLDCCCYDVCGCPPCVLVDYDIDTTGSTYPDAPFIAAGSAEVPIGGFNRPCRFDLEVDQGNGIIQILVHLNCGEEGQPEAYVGVCNSRPWCFENDLARSMPVPTGFPYDSGIIPIYSSGTDQVGTVRVRSC